MPRTPVVFAFLALMPACGIALDASRPLEYVAPLDGTWASETDSETELRVTVDGGQPRFGAQFEFTAELVEPGGTTEYDGSADEDTFELRDPATGAVVLGGTLPSNTMLRLDDGRTFTKPFAPDLVGVWQDANVASRVYVLGSQDMVQRVATGCARVGEDDIKEVDGSLEVRYAGDVIESWRVLTPGGLVAVRAPGVFVGYSAIRIKRIDGYLHLQRVDRAEECP